MREASIGRTVTIQIPTLFVYKPINANEGMTAAKNNSMQRTIQLHLDAKILSTDELALKRIVSLLSELEDKGFLKDSRIVFDSTRENEVKEIFDRHIPSAHTPESETK